MSNWIKRGIEEKEGKETLQGIEIKPEDINKAIEPKLNELKTGLSTELDTKLAPIMEFFKSQKEEREAAAETARRKAAKDQQNELEVQPEDWITDPESAVNKKLTPIVNSVMAQSAMLMRDKTLGKMDYYSTDPTFAAKVDSLIDSQPVSMRSNSNVIMNAYKSVFFDMQQDIKEGKIKSFASMASLSNNGTGGHSGSGGKDDATTLSAEEKLYARKMGLTEEQWVAGKRELEYV